MNQPSIVNNGFLKNDSYDIISNIFVYLDQRDCLNCMATCREWCDDIPQFTQDNWKTISFEGTEISEHQKRNLGKHVKDVTVCFDSGATMIQQLLDCGCTEIESLGKIL